MLHQSIAMGLGGMVRNAPVRTRGETAAYGAAGRGYAAAGDAGRGRHWCAGSVGSLRDAKHGRQRTVSPQRAGALRGFFCPWLLLSVAAVVCGCCVSRGCCVFARGDSSIGRCLRTSHGRGLRCGGLFKERRRQQHGPSLLHSVLRSHWRHALGHAWSSERMLQL